MTKGHLDSGIRSKSSFYIQRFRNKCHLLARVAFIWPSISPFFVSHLQSWWCLKWPSRSSHPLLFIWRWWWCFRNNHTSQVPLRGRITNTSQNGNLSDVPLSSKSWSLSSQCHQPLKESSSLSPSPPSPPSPSSSPGQMRRARRTHRAPCKSHLTTPRRLQGDYSLLDCPACWFD